jgi:multidrug efflux pump subunit AcrA (membrane-fusion protein)
VRFLEDRDASAPVSPTLDSRALVRGDDGPSVWVVRDGKVERRAVKAGDEQDGRVVVLEGLQGGEAVVVDPPQRLRDGAAVELQAE